MRVREWIFGGESFGVRGIEQPLVAADQNNFQPGFGELLLRFQCQRKMDRIVCFERMFLREVCCGFDDF